MKNISCALFLLSSISIASLDAQLQGSNWVMGYNSGIIMDSTIPCGKIVVKFETNKEPEIHCAKINTGAEMFNEQASISDELGNLIFYFDGYRIADSSHRVIVNGEGFNSGLIRNAYPSSYPLNNGILIIPDISDKNKWIVLHQFLDIVKNHPSGTSLFCTKILKSIVIRDTITNKLKVIEKNVEITNGLFVMGHFTATKHANGRDWWIITQGFQSSLYYFFLLTSDGIKGPFIQDVGQKSTDYDFNGNSVFSKDGSLYASSFPYNFIQVLDFDRCTGQLSNPRIILNKEAQEVKTVGYIEISPNNHYLYLSTYYTIWQYDLLVSDINASVKIVGQWDSTYYLEKFSTGFYSMSIADDDRIYIACYSGNIFLHRINYPNRAGDSCELKLRAITLPEFYVDINKVINYKLGPIKGSSCDSLTAINTLIQSKNIIFPSPANDNVYFNLINEEHGGKLFIFSITGNLIDQIDLIQSIGPTKIDVSEYDNGTYLFQYLESSSKKRILYGKFVVIH